MSATTCPGCGALYDEPSREQADSPDRRCGGCFKKEQRRRCPYPAFCTQPHKCAGKPNCAYGCID